MHCNEGLKSKIQKLMFDIFQLDDAVCGDTGKHFNPFNVDKSSSPPNGQGSSDQYEVGDLSGKYGDLAMKTEVAGSFVDPSITLFGRLSIVGRAVVIHKSPVPHRWVCANIEPEGVREVKTAVATFTYPGSNILDFHDNNKNSISYNNHI